MTIDLSQLDVETRARQLGRLEGEIGLAIAESLNVVNAGVHERAFGALEAETGSRILEVGFGNGHLVPKLLALAGDLSYAGIDISETMVDEATAFNKGAAVEFRVASSADIPFASSSFDRVLVLNTIYFWPDPSADLAEIRRVLRPGGRLVLGALAPSGARSNPVFRHGFEFYEKDQLSHMCTAAGFWRISIDVFNEVKEAAGGSRLAVDYYIVSAD